MQKNAKNFKKVLTKTDKAVFLVLMVFSALLAPIGIMEFSKSLNVPGYGGELAFIGMVFPSLIALKIRFVLKRVALADPFKFKNSDKVASKVTGHSGVVLERRINGKREDKQLMYLVDFPVYGDSENIRHSWVSEGNLVKV